MDAVNSPKNFGIRSRNTPLGERYVGSIDSRLVFPSRRGRPPLEQLNVIPCIVIAISANGATVAIAEGGTIGEPVVLGIPGIGILQGRVYQRSRAGIQVRFEASPDERLAIGSSVASLKCRSAGKRTLESIRPNRAGTIVTRSDGSTHTCTLMSVSRSGAAITVAGKLDQGERVTIGRLPATVVRSFAGGYGLEFEDVQIAEDYAEMLVIGAEIALAAEGSVA